MAELNFRRASAELLPRDAVLAELRRVHAAVRARLLAIPPRLGGAAEGHDAAEIERIAAEMIDDAFAEIQRIKIPGASETGPGHE